MPTSSALEFNQPRGADPRQGRATLRAWWEDIGIVTYPPSRVSDNGGVKSSALSPRRDLSGTREGDGQLNSTGGRGGPILIPSPMDDPDALMGDGSDFHPEEGQIGSFGHGREIQAVAAPFVSGSPSPTSSSD
jgi:hypothetical protein